MTKLAKKSKYTFVLKGVNTKRINNTYGIELAGDMDTLGEVPDDNITRITELNTSRGTPEVISFLDESKRLHTCNVSMIDFKAGMDVNLLRYHCFWDRNPFSSRPLGCPVKYVPSQAIKKYQSCISRGTYTIKENITRKRRQALDDDDVTVKTGEYYETYGAFCSFNCIAKFIDENKHNRLFDQSSILLTKMYMDMTGTEIKTFPMAPHWDQLDQYGGYMNIMKFREGFNKVEYECHGTTKNVPNFLPLGKLYEEKITF